MLLEEIAPLAFYSVLSVTLVHFVNTTIHPLHGICAWMRRLLFFEVVPIHAGDFG